MSLKISNTFEEIPIRKKIYDWTVDINNNNICGMMQPWGSKFDKYICANILGYNDGVVFTRIDNKFYSLILENIENNNQYKKSTYYNYLKTKHLSPQFLY